MYSCMLQTNENGQVPYRRSGTKPVFKRSADLTGPFHPLIKLDLDNNACYDSADTQLIAVQTSPF